ncbi:trypsin-like peptidase domain-containing protein [Microbacterium sp. VKM Ac-2870]|uniref:S1C family serine protease n=1 Tax=Microbacterium sp. VKM Ac-2870 TaxID=2783825 RepID=UPI00188BB4DF|nr:trypsin-like peptidase domain-containing protein [Microbacterium sp. VKM Ac-2870]MBF4560596.1 trypsin-like peptidase domain-containing protein [Microbacterium sp. VKM Ac-2870]
MSENIPSNTDPQDAAAKGDDATQSHVAPQDDASGATASYERPPMPAQSATYAAQAPAAPSGYAAHAPYTAPTAPVHGTHAPAYGAPAYGSAPYGAHPTAPYATAAAASAEPAAPSAKVGAGKIVGIMVAAALVGGAAGIGGAAAGASLFPQSQTVVNGAPSTVTVNNTASVNQTTAIAAKVLPSVVTISATAGSSGGTGSGVVLSADGYVVTNTHVVTLDGQTGDAKLSVTTSDGKVYAATIVGTDPTYDLAVIKLTDASGLTPIEFGDSSKLNVGDQTVAIGAPLGLSNTVTTGIVSALNRSIQIASSAAPEGDSAEQTPQQGDNGSPFQFDFGQGQQQQSTPKSSISIAVIQTDAAINPGNSGGALVDGQGKLIGINVAIASAGGSSSSGQSGSIGVGFSIESNIVQRVTDELIKNGKATHGLLGAGVRDAASQDGATVAGAYIADVTSGGAAAGAGLKKGDVVTSFNGFPVTNATDLTAQVRALAAGSKATIVYQRGGKSASAEVTLGQLQ